MPIVNQVDLVAAVKAEVLARGVLPRQQTTNCHSFEITGRVAWRMRDRGAALVVKTPAQNGCLLDRGPHVGRKVSHDAISFPDGWVDILANAGPPNNLNTPAWQWHTDPPSGTNLAPWDLDAAVDGAPPVPPPAGGSDDLARLQQSVQVLIGLVHSLPTVQQIDEIVAAVNGELAILRKQVERIEARQKLGVRGAFSIRDIHLVPPTP